MTMIHRVHSTELSEINRILELIQKGGSASDTVSQNTSTQTASRGSIGFSGSPTWSGTKGDKGDIGATGPAGADGSAASLLVGAEHILEILLAPTGDVLTDHDGFALLGVKICPTIMVGSDTSSIGVLNAT
jgi:hypothetical protein